MKMWCQTSAGSWIDASPSTGAPRASPRALLLCRAKGEFGSVDLRFFESEGFGTGSESIITVVGS